MSNIIYEYEEISEKEYEKVCEILGKEPNFTEIGIFSVMWSEHCSYKHSKPFLTQFPTSGEHVLMGPGEGAGVVILESLDHAIARGATIYAEVAGYGSNSDAYHITAPHPEGLGAKNVMLAALDEAGMQPDEIDYINTHGTSTPIGDGAEVKAITAVFGEHAYKLNITMVTDTAGAVFIDRGMSTAKDLYMDITMIGMS